MINKKLLFLLYVCALLLIGTNDVYAKGEVTFYAKLKTQVASSCSNMGKVYAGTSNSAGTYNASSSTSGELNSGEQASGTTEYTIGTFYAFAQKNSGYKFIGWKETDKTDAAIVSTANPYSLSIKSTSQTSGNGTQKILYAFFEKTVSVNITFIGDAKGSYQYTISGATSTVDGSNKSEADVAEVTLSSPSPKTGYAFAGFYQINTDGTTTDLSGNNPSVTFTESGSISIGARFVSTSLPKFLIKETSTQYYGLKAACAAATPGQTIVPVSDATLTGEDLLAEDNGVYIIPSGVTLLIPYDAANTVEKDQPTSVDPAAASNCKPYRTLTLADGITLSVSGAISVATKQYATNTTYTQTGVRTYYGFIYLNANSKIVLNSGATLYAWGYISGDGEVIANSGSTVYEMFQFQDFRGGSRTYDMKGNSKKVFPFQQYYIQNIESKLTLEYGATEYVRFIIYMSDTQFPNTIKLVGTDGAMFTMSGGSGKVTKQYERSTDRMHYTFLGTASLSSISMSFTYSIFSATVNSKDYVLPINNNMTIDILSGTTFNMTQDISVLPGAEINIESGAKVVVPSGKALYVYDQAEWKGKGCCFSNVDLKQLAHVGRNHNNTYGAPKTRSITSSAKIKVDGTLEVSGTLYTTTTGADIYSSGSGVVSMKVAARTATKTYQDKGNSDYQEIGITAAKLHNADGSYTATAGAAANTTITYANGHWGWVGIWKDYNGTTLKVANTCLESQLTSTTAPSYTTSYSEGCYDYTGTSTTATSTWTATRNEAKQEVVYTPVYASTAKTYTVTYLAGANGTGSVEAGTKTCGEDLALSAATFTRAGYLQTGWSTQDGGAKAYDLGGSYTTDAAITLYPFWTLNTFSITWKSENGSITLQTDENQNAGTPTAFNGDTPNKDATAQYTYTFDGWTTAANGGGTFYANGATPEVSADATYYAHFSAATNTYTVTWKNVNNVILETDENVPYGTMPTYDGETPAHPDYVDNIRWDRPFEGWTPAIGNVTGNVEYTAAYGSETAKTYTIIWQDYDGTELARSTANYGWNWPEYPGETPQRSDEKVNYTFIGWTEPATSLVAGNAIFTAVYRGDIEVAENEQKIITENTVVTTATIRALGRIDVANAAKLTTENLIIEATPNKSGEVVVSGDMEVTGEAYFDFEVNSDDWHWNAFGVPFEIDLTEHAPLLERITPMTLGYDYDIVYYNANTRAEQGPSDRCWDYVEQHGKKLIPGKMYLIVFNHHLPHVDVIRFTKASGKPVDYTEEVPLTVTGTGINDNWNGISNPKMYHALLDAGVTECQVHDGGAIGEDAYIMHNMNNKKFFVGKAAFVQSPASQSVVIATPATTQLPIVAQAPRRAAAEAAIDHYDVQIASEYSDLDDRIYVLTAEEKEDKYVIVADLAKAGVSKARAQMWVNRYGTKLCKNTTELVDYQANYPLGIFAPAEGNYDLFIDEQPNDGSMLYLTLDGEAIWNLSYGGYTVRLEEGTTNRYGLRVVAKAPQITTPIEEVTIENGETIRKIISGDMIYIIRNGETYTITGQKTK